MSGPADRITAMREPSGDQLGKPNAPPAASASGRDDPSVSMIDSELSPASSAMDPVDASGWSIAMEVAGDPLDDGLFDGADDDAGADADGLAGADGGGVGPAQAAVNMPRTTHQITPLDLIGQRYAADVPADAIAAVSGVTDSRSTTVEGCPVRSGRVTRKHRFLQRGARTQPSG